MACSAKEVPVIWVLCAQSMITFSRSLLPFPDHRKASCTFRGPLITSRIARTPSLLRTRKFVKRIIKYPRQTAAVSQWFFSSGMSRSRNHILFEKRFFSDFSWSCLGCKFTSMMKRTEESLQTNVVCRALLRRSTRAAPPDERRKHGTGRPPCDSE